MYVMLDYIKRRKLPIIYGFVHVPCRYDPKKVLRLLRRALASSKFKACPELVERVQGSTPERRSGRSIRSSGSKR